jgi:hypothetical protein
MKQIRTTICLIAIAFLGVFASAQTPTGTIQGVVTDKTGAAVQGASVTVIRTTTNETKTSTTDSAGRYSFVFVEPGVYNVTAQASGFRAAKQDNVLVQVTETRPVNFSLEVGAVAQTVEVNAQDVQALDTETSSLGETIQTETILQLPDQGRNPFDFAFLVPGVNNVGNASTPHIGGSRNGNNEQLIDGMTNITPENNIGNNISTYTPVEDSVQEMNVQTNVLPAENGRFSGGTESLVTKSGGNQWHGTYFEFIQNAALNAASFAGIGQKRSPNSASHQYQSGGTVSGPIIKNKAFFFFDYQYQTQAAGTTATDKVPAADFTNGDFTSLFGSTNPVLFDPDTVAKNGQGVYVRQPFVVGGKYNIIPSGRLSPVAVAALKYFPKANIAGACSSCNNYQASGAVPGTDWHFDSREDADITQKWHSFLRYSMDHNTYNTFNDFGNVASNGGYGGQGHAWVYSGSFNNTITFTPKLVGEFRYGYSRQTSNRVPAGGGFDPSKLGFDANYVAQTAKQLQIFPHFGFGGSNNGGFTDLGPLGYEGLQEDPMAQSINGSLVKIAGAHTLKFGGEFRQLRLNFYQYTYPSGDFSSDDSWTRQFPATNDSNTANPTGYSIASLLLGLPSSGRITNDPKYITTSQYIAFYAQDDWKVTPKLTVNAGMRYDLEVPREEQKNQMVFWDPTAASPLQGNASIATSLTASGVSCPYCSNLHGAMTIVGASGAKYGRRQGPTQKNDWGPRLGLAYNPLANLVIRAGLGVVYQPSALQASGTSGGSGDDGFDVESDYHPSFNNQQSLPVASLYSPDPAIGASAQNPFPTGYASAQAETSSCLASTACTQGIDIGNGVSTAYFDSYRTPYSIQWNLNAQFSLAWGIKAEVGYLGNRGLFLVNGDPGLPIDQLTTNTLIANGCTVGATTAQCKLLNQVTNPFQTAIGPGTPYYVPGLSLSGGTVSLGQLQHRFPQYNGVSSFRKPDSASAYSGYTFSAQKATAKGLSFTYSFTYGKEFDNGASPVGYLGPTSGTYADQYNPRAEWGLGAQNVLWDNAASFVYELPIGPGRAFLNHGNAAASKFVSGWQISGIENYSAGTPVVISGVNNGTTQAVYGGLGQRPDWSGTSPKLPSKSAKLWFNPTVYSVPLPFEIGNAPRTIGVNQPSYQNLDLQIAKNTRFHDDKYNFQARVEMFNAFNHASLGGPGTSVGSGNFGVIQNFSGTARRIQFAGKFVF